MLKKWPRPLAAELTALSVAACALVCVNLAIYESEPKVELDLRDAPNSQNVETFHPSITGNPGMDCAFCHQSQKRTVIQAGLWMSSAFTGDTFIESSGDATSEGTRTCVSCHDGTIDHKIGLNGPRGEHPMGMDYFDAYNREPAKYVSPYNNPIKLEDRKVGCVSCHAIHENTGHIANARPRNCLICHKM
jgi:hypothetical protein